MRKSIKVDLLSTEKIDKELFSVVKNELFELLSRHNIGLCFAQKNDTTLANNGRLICDIIQEDKSDNLCLDFLKEFFLWLQNIESKYQIDHHIIAEKEDKSHVISKESLEKHLLGYGVIRKGIPYREYGFKTHSLINFKLALKRKYKKFKNKSARF